MVLSLQPRLSYARTSLNDVVFIASPHWYVLKKRMFQKSRGEEAGLIFRQYAAPLRKGVVLPKLKNIHLLVCQPGRLNYVSLSLPEDMVAQGISKELRVPKSKAHIKLEAEKVTTIHKQIFDKVDTDKDGKVTPEELQAFMRE